MEGSLMIHNTNRERLNSRIETSSTMWKILIWFLFSSNKRKITIMYYYHQGSIQLSDEQFGWFQNNPICAENMYSANHILHSIQNFSLPSPGPTTNFHRYCMLEDKQYSCTEFWLFYFYWAVHDNLTLKYHGVSEFEMAFKELCRYTQLIQGRKIQTVNTIS